MKHPSPTPPTSILGIRGKLLIIFVLIKVIPLLLLAFFLWYQLEKIGGSVQEQITELTEEMEETISEVGAQATADAVMALNDQARESIERLTTDTARSVAQFLYVRDADINQAAELPQTRESFKYFLKSRKKNVLYHEPWQLRPDQSGWEQVRKDPVVTSKIVTAKITENSKEFHHRAAEFNGESISKPLYLEMTAIDLTGKETLKVTAGGITNPGLADISDPLNTYVKAEHYFAELQKLKPGEIYVSDVIGAYVGSKVIGQYTPAAVAKRGLEYEPHLSGYAGKENPMGRRFQGIIRWATPVVSNGQVTGYVSLALDHTHVMEFTDHLVPTETRYSPISDASTGNYAFMWDAKARNISHPRDYFIVGYDSETGKPAVPWLEEKLYRDWKDSGVSIEAFLKQAPKFHDQGHDKKPSKELMSEGNIALDCRYLNFAPQCAGWMNLTQQGGSGSFVIFWSGLWKLTTAASIPYFTGQYGDSPRGFGFVTIGANVKAFHQPAIDSQTRLTAILDSQSLLVNDQKTDLNDFIKAARSKTYRDISLSTLAMIVIVILIAIWMASYLTKRITELVVGIKRFENGDMKHRLEPRSGDEMGQLVSSFNTMAGKIEKTFYNLELSAEKIGSQNRENQYLMEEMAKEIRHRKSAEKELNHLAYFDPLTNLPNRFLAMDRLLQLINEAHRHEKQVAVVFIDLDDFKKINDTLGHDTGDLLLAEAADRLQKTVRSGDTVGRLGGDEFIVLLGELADITDAQPIVEKLLNHLRKAFRIEGRELILSASVGIAVYPDDGLNPLELLRNADSAMYHSKALGRNTYSYFTEAMNKAVSRRVLLEEQMHGALGRGEFRLEYQPQVDVITKKIVGVEALLRWHNPVLDNVSPEEFIPIAEHTGLIVSIGQFVLKEALKMTASWHLEGKHPFTMAVNLSPRQFRDPHLVEFIQESLEQTNVSAESLELEITEGVLMSGYSYIDKALSALSDLGIGIAMDDFGTGYSSLSYLRSYPFDVLKIDRSFVNDITENAADRELINAAIAMAHSLGLKVVAEGVETEGQLALLAEKGCEYAQGYLFSKPVSATEITWMFETSKDGRLELTG